MRQSIVVTRRISTRLQHGSTGRPCRSSASGRTLAEWIPYTPKGQGRRTTHASPRARAVANGFSVRAVVVTRSRRGPRALIDGWRRREIISARALVLLMASFAPPTVLTELHAARRGFRAAVRKRLGIRRDAHGKAFRVRNAANEPAQDTRDVTQDGGAG